MNTEELELTKKAVQLLNDRNLKELKELLAEQNPADISNIFEEITIDSLPDSDEIKVIHVKTEDKYYRAVMKLIVSDSPDDEMVKTDINQLMDNSRLISVFLYDETDMMELEQKREAENLVVGLLYIDNYDELIDSIDEIRQSLIMALIDRKINKYMQGIDAISK